MVVVVLRGREGVGKSLFGRLLRRILAQHSLAVSNPKHVVGNFNAHLRDVVFLQCDEALFAGDARQSSVLKALITDDTITNEPKGLNAFQQRNYLHLLMTTNERWAINAGADSRRFFVVDVADTHRNDPVYFGRLMKAIEDDSVVGAVLHFLLGLDLTGFDIVNVPVTDALRDQRVRSLSGFMGWAVDLSIRGEVRAEVYDKSEGRYREEPREWREYFATEELFHDYETWERRQRYGGRPLARETFGRELATLGLEYVRRAPSTVTDMPSSSGKTRLLGRTPRAVQGPGRDQGRRGSRSRRPGGGRSQPWRGLTRCRPTPRERILVRVCQGSRVYSDTGKQHEHWLRQGCQGKQGLRAQVHTRGRPAPPSNRAPRGASTHFSSNPEDPDNPVWVRKQAGFARQGWSEQVWQP